MERLPDEHKAKWLAGSALYSADQAMMSVMSTALSRLNSFIDSEMEQILCFGTALDAEKILQRKVGNLYCVARRRSVKIFHGIADYSATVQRNSCCHR